MSEMLKNINHEGKTKNKNEKEENPPFSIATFLGRPFDCAQGRLLRLRASQRAFGAPLRAENMTKEVENMTIEVENMTTEVVTTVL
jgi:hypothetical protein